MSDAEELEAARRANRKMARVTAGFSSVRPFICVKCGAHVPGDMSDITAAVRHLKWHRRLERQLKRLGRDIKTWS